MKKETPGKQVVEDMLKGAFLDHLIFIFPCIHQQIRIEDYFVAGIMGMKETEMRQSQGSEAAGGMNLKWVMVAMKTAMAITAGVC